MFCPNCKKELIFECVYRCSDMKCYSNTIKSNTGLCSLRIETVNDCIDILYVPLCLDENHYMICGMNNKYDFIFYAQTPPRIKYKIPINIQINIENFNICIEDIFKRILKIKCFI